MSPADVPSRPLDLARVLVGSPFFDPAYYAEQAGCSTKPLKAARHYLRHGNGRRLSPHPLFVPRFAASACPALTEDGADPLVGYIVQRRFDVQTHPLFDLTGYVREVPAAATHPTGPLGHYLERGAAEGASPNDWYRARPDEPRGLSDWVVSRHREWRSRRAEIPRLRSRMPAVEEPATLGAPESAIAVSVVIDAGAGREATEDSIRSAVAQEPPPRQLIVLTSGATGIAERLPDVEVPIVTRPRATTSLRDVLAAGSGECFAFMLAGETWESGRLARLVSTYKANGRRITYDSLRLVRPGTPEVYECDPVPDAPPNSRLAPSLSRFLVPRDVLVRLTESTDMRSEVWDCDLVHSLLAHGPTGRVAQVGATRVLPRSDQDTAPGGAARARLRDVAFNKHAVDWPALVRREPHRNVVTVVVTTAGDWRQTRACVSRISALGAPARWKLECLVVDDGSDAVTAQVLDSLPYRFPAVTVHHLPARMGSALSTNLALPHVVGEVVVFVDRDIRPQTGWLEPLVDALDDEEVLGAQSLILDRAGLIGSAGYAFAEGMTPYDFLASMPAEDAVGLEAVRMSGVSRAASAFRVRDVAAVQGLDPRLQGPFEDADLCLRLRKFRAGHYVVRPDSRVSRMSAVRASGPGHAPAERSVWLNRWAGSQPIDEDRLWASRGFRVAAARPSGTGGTDDGEKLRPPAPVLVREPGHVSEQAPRLRWAIKIAAPSGEWGERWGDTHFARSLAVALRRLGQHVTIDHREALGRPSAMYDDVVLVLRGLETFRPLPQHVSLLWVISHPATVCAQEAMAFDRVFAASTTWADIRSREWRVRVDPLLQATEPKLFNPDRALSDTGHRVLFVGGSRKEFRPIVRQAVDCGLPLAVYGSDWERFIPGGLIRATSVTNTDLGAMYASAGFVLNDHWEDMRREGFLSNRLFDAVASGSRVVTDDVRDLDRVFGRSVQVVRSRRELKRLVHAKEPDSIFGTASERRIAALSVHRDHSFDRRAAQLLAAAVEIYRSRAGSAHRESALTGH